MVKSGASNNHLLPEICSEVLFLRRVNHIYDKLKPTTHLQVLKCGKSSRAAIISYQRAGYGEPLVHLLLYKKKQMPRCSMYFLNTNSRKLRNKQVILTYLRIILFMINSKYQDCYDTEIPNKLLVCLGNVYLRLLWYTLVCFKGVAKIGIWLGWAFLVVSTYFWVRAHCQLSFILTHKNIMYVCQNTIFHVSFETGLISSSIESCCNFQTLI